MKEYLLPIVVIVVNLWLGASSGMTVFYIAAAVIFILLVLKWRHRAGEKRGPGE